MAGVRGQEGARQGGAKGGRVVFTTAYEDYAIRAVEAGAADDRRRLVQDARLAQEVERRRGRLAEARAPDFECIGIDGDDDLEARYGVRVPVLVDRAAGRELGWPFDVAAIASFLRLR